MHLEAGYIRMWRKYWYKQYNNNVHEVNRVYSCNEYNFLANGFKHNPNEGILTFSKSIRYTPIFPYATSAFLRWLVASNLARVFVLVSMGQFPVLHKVGLFCLVWNAQSFFVYVFQKYMACKWWNFSNIPSISSSLTLNTFLPHSAGMVHVPSEQGSSNIFFGGQTKLISELWRPESFPNHDGKSGENILWLWHIYMLENSKSP